MSSQNKPAHSPAREPSKPAHGACERRLRTRLRELREEVCAELIAEDEERYLEVIGGAREWTREPVAARLRALELEPVNRHLPEIDRIERALGQLEAGTYGTCMDCGNAIEADVLATDRTAVRCARCRV